MKSVRNTAVADCLINYSFMSEHLRVFLESSERVRRKNLIKINRHQHRKKRKAETARGRERKSEVCGVSEMERKKVFYFSAIE